MKLFGWFRRETQEDPLAGWRRTWTEAVGAPSTADPESLRKELDAHAASGADVEVEMEMLDALEHLRELQRVSASALPVIPTQHRVIGTEPCHFTAPASQPADPAQASGRLLATPTRIIFVGGGRNAAIPWHTIHRVERVERDVLLLRADSTPAAHFRFNTYGDALSAAFLAQHFKRR